MKYIEGNLLDLAENGVFDIIVHGVNCFCTMKNGIAKQISERYPEVSIIDRLTKFGDKSKLGTIQDIFLPQFKFTVVNAYTQYRYGNDKQYTDYDAVKSCFSILYSKFNGKRIGIPKIGCGLGGGNWNIVSEIINSIFSDNITCVTYGR